MASNSLDKFIGGPVIQSDAELEFLLREVDKKDDAVFFIPNIQAGAIEHINSTCSKILGYAASEFLNGGPDFIFSITDPEVIPGILERQATYTRAAKVPGFDPAALVVHEFPTTMITKNSMSVDLLCLSAPLTYTTHAEMEIALCLLVRPFERQVDDGRQLLTKIKAQHNRVFQHPGLNIENEGLQRLYTTAERVDKLITMREKDVLALLSKGFSTKQIADMLSISAHTAESHRKSLLEKFHAKNAAELVKKASKVFWLE